MKNVYKFIIPTIFLTTVLVVSYFVFFNSSKTEEKFGKLPDLQLNSVVVGSVKTENLVDKIYSPKIPAIANVYKKGVPINFETIIQKLNFNGKGKKLGIVEKWTEKNRFIKYNTVTKKFTFVDQNPVNSGKLDQNQVIDKALTALKELGFGKNTNNLYVIDTREYALVGTHAEEVNYGEKADVFSITFGLKLNSFEVVGKNGDKNLIEMWISTGGRVVKIEAPTTPIDAIDSSTYAITPLDQVKKQLENGEGVIVDTDGSLRTDETVKIKYTRASLVYVHDGAGNYFQPVYLFEGFSIGRDASSVVKVVTMIPAIDYTGSK